MSELAKALQNRYSTSETSSTQPQELQQPRVALPPIESLRNPVTADSVAKKEFKKSSSFLPSWAKELGKTMLYEGGGTALGTGIAAPLAVMALGATNPWTLPLSVGAGAALWETSKGAMSGKDPLETLGDAAFWGMADASTVGLGRVMKGAKAARKARFAQGTAGIFDKIFDGEARWKAVSKLLDPIADMPLLPKSSFTKASGGRTLREWFVPAVERMPKEGAQHFTSRRVEGAFMQEALNQVAHNVKGIQSIEGRKGVIDLMKNKFDPAVISHLPQETADEILLAVRPLTDRVTEFRQALSPIQKGIMTTKVQKGFEKLFKDTDDLTVQAVNVFTQNKPWSWRKKLHETLKNPLLPDEVRTAARDLYDLEAITVKEVSKNYASAMDAVMYNKLLKTPGIVSPNPAKGYVKGDRGAFKDLWVDKNVWDELSLMYDTPGSFTAAYNKYFLTPWKTFKVIARSPTQFRNIMTIFIQNDLFSANPLSPARQDYYLKAIGEMKKRSPRYLDFVKKSGVSASTWSASELKPYEQFMRSSAHPVGKIFDMAMHYTTKPFMNVFNNIESWGKYTKYIHNLDSGMNSSEAIEDALRATFDYTEITKATKRAKETIMPFATWQFKVARKLPETIVKHPVRFGKYFVIPTLMTQASLGQLGMSREEFGELKKKLPDYIKNGWYMVLPFRDEKGRMQMFNLTWIIPGLGDIAEIGGSMKGEPSKMIEHYMQNPIVSLLGDITSGTKRSGAPIYMETDDPSTQWMKLMGHVWNQLGPTWLPGGVDWNQVQRAFDQPNSPYSLTPTQSIAAQFGLKVTPVDEAQANVNFYSGQARKLGDIKSDLNRRLIYGEDQPTALEDFQKRMQNWVEKY